jgi:hypothetical protein
MPRNYTLLLFQGNDTIERIAIPARVLLIGSVRLTLAIAQ